MRQPRRTPLVCLHAFIWLPTVLVPSHGCMAAWCAPLHPLSSQAPASKASCGGREPLPRPHRASTSPLPPMPRRGQVGGNAPCHEAGQAGAVQFHHRTAMHVLPRGPKETPGIPPVHPWTPPLGSAALPTHSACLDLAPAVMVGGAVRRSQHQMHLRIDDLAADLDTVQASEARE